MPPHLKLIVLLASVYSDIVRLAVGPAQVKSVRGHDNQLVALLTIFTVGLFL